MLLLLLWKGHKVVENILFVTLVDSQLGIFTVSFSFVESVHVVEVAATCRILLIEVARQLVLRGVMRYGCLPRGRYCAGTCSDCRIRAEVVGTSARCSQRGCRTLATGVPQNKCASVLDETLADWRGLEIATSVVHGEMCGRDTTVLVPIVFGVVHAQGRLRQGRPGLIHL